MSNVSDLIEAFKREVAIPGTFAEVFPDTTDEDIEGQLADAFAETQLDGFFGSQVLDVDAGEVTPDLSTAGTALVVIYAGIRTLRSYLRSLHSSERYKAGPTEYEVQHAASLLREDLLQLVRRRDQLLTQAQRSARVSIGTTFVDDLYPRRALLGYGPFYAYELTG